MLASLVRADWTFYTSHPALFLSTYLAHGLLVDYFEKKRRCGVRIQENNTTNLEWLASLWDWYTSYLLHPITSFQQVPFDPSDWEDDPNLLFERLAFPDLWLRPLVSMDYIKTLPTWKFRVVDHNKRQGSRENMNYETNDSHSDIHSKDHMDSPSAGPSRSFSDQEDNTQPHVDNNTDLAAAPPSFQCHDGNKTSTLTDGPLEYESVTPEGVPNQHSDWSLWPRDMLQCSECVVCLENFMSEELLMGLPCGHAFHQQCVVVWLSAGRHCCPVCRWPSFKKKKQQRAAQSSSAENTQQEE